MAYKRITKDELISQDYAHLPLTDVQNEYRKGIPTATVLARLQNLEGQLDKLEEEQHTLALKGKIKPSNRILDFQRNYARELDFIYSQGVANQDFAWQRLTRQGKSSRISETMLIARYGTIPFERLFDSEHLDSVERVALAETYLVPLEFINKRAKRVEERIRETIDMIANAHELGAQGEAFRNKLNTELDGLKYERDALYDLAIRRTSKGPDKNI